MRSAYDLRSEACIHHHTEPGAQDLQKIFLLHTDMHFFCKHVYIYVDIQYMYVYMYMYMYMY